MDSSIPTSDVTVSVRIIDSSTTLRLDTGVFWQEPDFSGFDGVDAPDFCFLITHGDRHVVFDLGVRPDWRQGLPPHVVSVVERTTSRVQAETDVASILDADAATGRAGAGVGRAAVEAVVWSHSHFDHLGDPSTFPPGTALVVGAALHARHAPGFPARPDAGILERDVRGRRVRALDVAHEGAGLRVGGFPAYDYFGDGSFYLLDAPGHDAGNLCGLARVARTPREAFVLMGGDVAHHAGVLRPTAQLPLPRSLAARAPGGRPQDAEARTTPFLTLSKMAFPEYEAALETVRKVQALDAREDVLVVLAHDQTLLGQVELFPKPVDGWRETGVKERTRWLFVDDFTPSGAEA